MSWDEKINHIINECIKLAQKEYKTRHDWAGEVIHWEVSKKFKFDHAYKWYLHNPESVLENATHKTLGFGDINRLSNLGQTTRPSYRKKKQQQQQQKRTCWIMDFAVPADHRVKLKKTKKRDKYQDLARELKKETMEYESYGETNCNWCTRYRLAQGLEDLETRGRVETIQTTALLGSAKNSEKSPGDLRRLAITQTPVKNTSANADTKKNSQNSLKELNNNNNK